MHNILQRPAKRVDDNYLYAVGIVMPGLVTALGLDNDDNKMAALLRGLYTVHNAGELHNAAQNIQDMDRNDGRSPSQRLYDLRVLNETTVAQVVPAEASALSN